MTVADKQKVYNCSATRHFGPAWQNADDWAAAMRVLLACTALQKYCRHGSDYHCNAAKHLRQPMQHCDEAAHKQHLTAETCI